MSYDMIDPTTHYVVLATNRPELGLGWKSELAQFGYINSERNDRRGAGNFSTTLKTHQIVVTDSIGLFQKIRTITDVPIIVITEPNLFNRLLI